MSGGYIYHGHCKVQYANVKATDDSRVGIFTAETKELTLCRYIYRGDRGVNF